MGKPGKILALDFDGVLHHYTGWNNGIMGRPQEGAVEFCRQAVERFKIYVVSSRCNNEVGMEAVLSWLAKYDFPEEMIVTAERPPAYVSLDDRALTFTGIWPSVNELLNFQPWWKTNLAVGEIPMAEMQQRMHLIADNKGKEYGYALSLIGDKPLDTEVISSAKIIVERSFREHAKTVPGLVDWAFVVGPDKPVWSYEDCINSPDGGETCSKGEDCSYCDGFGRVPVEIIPDKLEYCYGWYSIVANQ